MKKIPILTLVMGLIFLGMYVYYREGSLPVNAHDASNTMFIIRRGENIVTIAKNLENAHLIRNRMVFFFIVKQLDIDQKIQAGNFRLSKSMSAEKIAQNLTKGTLDIWITVIEGLRKEEIAQIVSQELALPESEFDNRAQEGYLFPDTYLVPRTVTVVGMLNIFARNFKNKVTPDILQKAAQKGLTEHELLTLASLVEKEARSPKNKQIVASIMLKRIKKGWSLQVDASVQYALGYQVGEKSWWKRNLTIDDIKINSPYNTYKNPGLPPGPICNPGLASINAVVNADESIPYWFYLSSKDGSTMHYAKTIEEHNENIRNYLQ